MPYLITKEAKSRFKDPCELAEIPVKRVKCLHADYLGRKSISGVNFKNAYNFGIDLNSDLEMVSYTKTVINNLVKDKADDDFLVFRFICDVEDGLMVKSNITPIIMSKDSFDILDRSDRGGRNGSPMGTKERIANWEIKVGRMKRIEKLEDYYNEAFGIAHEVKKVKCFLKSGKDEDIFFNCLFIWDTDAPLDVPCEAVKGKSTVRKTNVVFFLSPDNCVPDLDDEKWSDHQALGGYYDNGTECCPI